MKDKPKKIYRVINNHPIYESEEEKQESYKKCAIALALEAERLRELYPEEKF